MAFVGILPGVGVKTHQWVTNIQRRRNCSCGGQVRRRTLYWAMTTAGVSRAPGAGQAVVESRKDIQRGVISSLENVSYDIGGVTVVEDVSLEMRAGEIVCILGPSGSGKSTILRMVAGLSKPTRGRVLYHGREFSGTNPGASMVFQTFALFPWLTVLENVEMGIDGAVPGLDSDMKRRRALRSIDIIGLDGYENAYPRELSGGMRQRVGFARALAVEPELLCMDEPFSALDVLTAENLRSELLRLWQTGEVPTATILIVTHGIEEAVSLADRVIILGRDPGKIRISIPVALSHPRDTKSLAFQRLVDHVYTIIADPDAELGDLSLPNGDTVSPSTVDTLYSSPESAINLRDPLLIPNVSSPLRSRKRVAIGEVNRFGVSDEGERDHGAKRYPSLPTVRIGSVAGFISFIGEDGVDLFRLGQKLQLDVDDLYPIVEAAEILGLIRVDDGDVAINERGRRFMSSSIDERKSLVRRAMLRSEGCQLIQQIVNMLEQAGGANNRLPQELIFDTILLKHFSTQEARRQLEVAIEWGRFAELFGYDAPSGECWLFEDLRDGEEQRTFRS
eukprot:Plantae.Rhodophyta-Hildenbrandia_rubra.ctg7109.p1 GENE.Plantae.Rhodophyta-Hildenbrandia_rubra.ctg7109~~Plantae.Rhodophyta-Hildenbrandia_rubra.ctg7109.p1  ORF type:complete len:563 (+),score=79.35 Plantae.Rhodophyta-Hildenbrandia_rubra.ctg7109:262-1950(+)